MTVRLSFQNRTSGTTDAFDIERGACEAVARWYGAYHAGDDYSVEIDGENIPIDINGDIAPRRNQIAP